MPVPRSHGDWCGSGQINVPSTFDLAFATLGFMATNGNCLFCFHSLAWKNENQTLFQMWLKLLNAGFETRFGWYPQHQMCWDPIAKHISNLDVAPF